MLTALLTLHKLTAFITIVGFFARGLGHIFDKAWVQKKTVKIAPHINDTLLLISAVLLVSMSGHSFTDGWVIAKILGLIAYIVLGIIAFKKAKTRLQKALFWLFALGVIVYVAAVAKTKLVWPFIETVTG